MIYESLGRCGLKVSVVGLGCEHLEGKDYQIIDSVVKTAIECGINIFDVFMSEPNVRSNIGKALTGIRDNVILQGHIGSIFEKGQYKRSRDIKQNQVFFEDFLKRLKTDYVDIGMIHFVDTPEDFDIVFNSDIIEYAVKLKEQGIIKAVGLSSHEPATAIKAIKTGFIDVLMFSVNPAYDLLPQNTQIDVYFKKDTYSNDRLLGIDPIRNELYSTCERMDIGITTMKSLAAGQLLNAKTSPFGKAMTVHQCIHYALNRPGVKSVLIGCKTLEQVLEAVNYAKVTDGEKDYTLILSQTPKYSMTGKCMYCNHCLPCPSNINIASVTKYLDLATIDEIVPASVVEHYMALATHASDCIECGTCESNCPFAVKIIENMRRAQEVFGN